jgi:uncharacterized membrane protein/nitrite reductase/ring-hydroxylating ferredoxin subunit
MRTKAHLKGRPLHPALVSFPTAFFIAVLCFDLLDIYQKTNTFKATSKYLVLGGIISGIVAAIPGIIDYFKTVPPKSSAKRRAGKHGLINSFVIVLFCVLFNLRDILSAFIVVGIEALAVMLMIYANWMGGTLVHRNQIGVDIRYAEAGKWKEKKWRKVTGPIVVAKSDELKVNQMMLLHINKIRIVLGRTEKGYAAFDDRCTHRGASLAGGSLMCGTVQCPWHGSQFDVNSGCLKAGPSTTGISVYKLEEINGQVLLHIN